MKSKLILALLFSFLMANAVVGQEKEIIVSEHERRYVSDFDLNKVYHKETGQKISELEFSKIVNDNSRAFFEKETDDEGNLIRHLYDPNNQIDGGDKIMNTYITEDVPFPNFSVTTIDNEKIALKDQIGKLTIVRFELATKTFQHKKHEVEALDKKINALGLQEDVEAIIIFRSPEDEVREAFNLTNSNFKVVANGYKIIQKYYINRFPTTLLIDQNGGLIGIYTDSGEIELEEHLNK